jgi:hypothetical protein
MRCRQQLANAVRRVKSCVWLTNLAYEMGFRGGDIEKYKHRKHTYTVACKGGSAVVPSEGPYGDDHELPRGLPVNAPHMPRVVPRRHNQPWLVPVVTCTVVEEPPKKRGKQSRLQAFTLVGGRARMGRDAVVVDECNSEPAV